ncbi:uncharacterized protein LOC111697131 [Eurytemora carolleeae]|uniref:uncharacterized protein LOC111697131 n=1 Tax=Eurytemora carolleeae TaxID=1294199 RepID=UPI000C7585E2|nr:uncharacterized protein LOC111697131 [Eurytemora carolleeae]|eukprot:XP_023322798.1 uncharacterized protein LOC111697131 [Eurytemora affinis]
MIFGTAWPFTAWRKGNVSPARYEGSSKNFFCCTKIWFVELLLCISTIGYVLVIALAASMIYYGKVSDVDYKGLRINPGATGAELMIVGVSGTLVNLLGLFGIWKRQRLFLVPVLVFLISIIVLDLITLITTITLQIKGDPVFAHYEDLEVLDIDPKNLSKPVRFPTDRTFNYLFPLFIFKIFISILFLRILVDVYRKDPTLRTSRSPLRTVAVDKSQFDDSSPKMKKYTRFV